MREALEKVNPLTSLVMLIKDTENYLILVEGQSDITFYKTVFYPPCKVMYKQLEGWENIVQQMRMINEKCIPRICGIIDKDFHDILNDSILEIENIFYTDEHDIESLLFFSSCYDKFLSIYCSESKLSELDDIRECILSAASPIGALRYISLLYDEKLWFNGIEYKDFINKQSLAIDTKKLIDKIYNRTRAKGHSPQMQPDIVLEKIKEIIGIYAPKQLCTGHDILGIIALGTQKKLASHNANDYPEDAIFKHMLMAYDRMDFEKTLLYKKLVSWIELTMPSYV